MDRRRPRAAERSSSSPHRFLRPGALARLRDSRIVARSLRSSSACLLLPRPAAPPSPAPPVAVPAAAQAVAPRFLGTGGYRRYPLRRRVAAARGVAFFAPPPSP